MAYSYPNITGKEIKRGPFSYQAVAENKLSGAFDTLEDCAQTSLSVIVKDEKGEQIATVDLDAAFCFYENAAAGDVCEALEPAVRALRVEDSDDSDCYNVPAYALPYLINADASGLDDEEIAAIDEWYAGLEVEGLSFTLDCVDSQAAPYFSNCPAFGLPAECERVAVTYFPDL